MPKRRMTLTGWADLQWGHDQSITWDELWMNTAELVSRRARCVRDRVGAVIVSSDNMMLSIGYNGAAAGFPADGPCDQWCPRAQHSTTDDLDPSYADCFALHAESNAILRLPRAPVDHIGASIYVNSAVCWSCAMMIANSGISRVVMNIKPKMRNRKPEQVVQLLQDCGKEVVVWRDQMSKYRRVFVDTYGIGPHSCHFCGVAMPWVEVIHHLNENHDDDSPDNLVASHARCHTVHHVGAAGGPKGPAPRITVTQAWSRQKPLLKCITCGLQTTPGWLTRHCQELGHSDGGAVAAWHEEQELKSRTCDNCGRVFETKRQRGAHKWRCERR